MSEGHGSETGSGAKPRGASAEVVELREGARLRSFPRPRTALLVLGMHRSGTSAITRVLSLLGADLPQRLMEPVAGDNPTGFWESREIAALHDELLESAGSAWDDVSPLPESWFSSDAAGVYEDRLLQLLERDFTGSSLFVVKDPRIARLVPLWQAVLQRFSADPRYVLIVRNPLEVAASLKARNDFLPAKSYLLWLWHLLESEASTRRQRRCFVLFDEVLRDWRGTARRLERQLQVSWPRRSATADVEIDEFLSERLRHHRARAEELEARSDAVGWVKRAYSAVLDAVPGDAAALAETLDSIRREVAAADIAFAPLVAQGRLRLARRDADLDALRQRLEVEQLSAERLSAEIGSRDGELAARDKEILRLTAELAAHKDEQQRLGDEIGRRDADLAAKSQEILRLGAEWASRRDELNRLAAEIGRRDTDLGAKSQEIHRLSAELAALQTEQQRLGNEIERRDAELAARSEEVQRLAAEIGRRDTDLGAKGEEIDRLGAELAALQTEQQRLGNEIGRRDAELAASSEEVQRLAAEVERRDAELEATRDEIRRLAAEGERRGAELEARNGEIDRLAKEVDRRESELTSQSDEIHRLAEELATREHETQALRREARARDERLAGQRGELQFLHASQQVAREAMRTIEMEVGTQQTLLTLRHDEIIRLRDELGRMRQQAAEAAAGLDRQSRRAHELQQQVAVRDAEIGRLSGVIDSREQETERLAQSLADSTDAADALHDRLGRAEGEVAARGDSLATARATIRSLEARLEHEQDLVRGFLHSRSWRLTRPLRFLSGTTRGLFGLGTVAGWLAGAVLPRRRRLRRRRGRFEASGAAALFDERHYRAQFADPREVGPDAVEHYLDRGFREGRDPHPLFDTAFYLKSGPAAADGEVVPLTHYFERGASEGRDPHPLFRTAFYLAGLPETPPAGENPLLHFLRVGAAEGHPPNPLFDPAFYLERYPDVAADGVNPLIHYLLFGGAEGRDPHPLFRGAHYLSQSPEVVRSGANPLHHFVAMGAARGLDPHPLFATSYYLARDPDVAASGLNPLVHFLTRGAAEGRQPHPFFDTAYYLEQNPDVGSAGDNPLLHYMASGAARHRDPHPRFDTAYYLATNPDADGAGISPLEHFLTVGAARGAWPLADSPDRHERIAADRLELFLSRPRERLALPRFDEPLVSLIIPTYDRAPLLYQCLESVLRHTDDVAFEVVVGDDASRDATAQLLAKVDNVKVVENRQNLDFVRTVNRAAAAAVGSYLLLLNNDVTLAPKWLSTLVSTIESYPKCGAVGVKLVWPDGALQEAGSIIWRDGSALGYGRQDDPARPEYCYLREIDFGSAACLLVRADLFRELGGLDERFLPAYYEDADLCFGIRKLGYKTVYQPAVAVSHHEFGTRSFELAAAQTRRNQPKFASKWAQRLAQQPAHGELLVGRDRRPGKRLLLIDDQIPAPFLGSGFPRSHRMLEMLAQLGFVTTFVASDNRTPHQPTTGELQQAGVEVFYGEGITPEDVLRARPDFYDVIVISRPHNGARCLELARECCPRAHLVYDAEALFCVREFLQAEVQGTGLDDNAKTKMLRAELELMRSADTVITVSEAERQRILQADGHPNVAIWGHALDLHEPSTGFEERRDILFVGGFTHDHPPNTDAAVHFVTELMPEIRRQLPGCRFIIAGSNPGEAVQGLACRDVVVTGFVEDLTDYYEKCRVFAVPSRFGAGISLKLLEAMSHGIPAVGTTLAATGLDIEDGREALIADSNEELAAKLVRLYRDPELWSAVQRASLDYIRRSCSSAVMRERLAEIVSA